MLQVLGVVNKQRVHQELSLEELFLINWTVEKTLELQIPKEVSLKFSCEKVELEVSCEIIKDSIKGIGLVLKQVPDRTMEQLEVFVEGIKQAMEDFCILFSKKTCMELCIGNRFTLFF